MNERSKHRWLSVIRALASAFCMSTILALLALALQHDSLGLFMAAFSLAGAMVGGVVGAWRKKNRRWTIIGTIAGLIIGPVVGLLVAIAIVACQIAMTH